jgi:hypothetical protein
MALFVWACRALISPKRRFLARAVTRQNRIGPAVPLTTLPGWQGGGGRLAGTDGGEAGPLPDEAARAMAAAVLTFGASAASVLPPKRVPSKPDDRGLKKLMRDPAQATKLAREAQAEATRLQRQYACHCLAVILCPASARVAYLCTALRRAQGGDLPTWGDGGHAVPGCD